MSEMRENMDQHQGDIEFSTSEENRKLALELIQQASRTVMIASYDLDRSIYSTKEFVEAVSGFIRSNRNARLDILVWRTTPAVKQGHRLIELSRRLSSSISIHMPDHVHENFIESQMIVDGTAYFRRPLADRHEGIASFHAPIIARELRDQFHDMWERSTPAPEFRRLRI